MNNEVTFNFYKEQLSKKKYQDKPIGIVLTDQKFIAGIGNYLRSDILWLSRINPFRMVKDLTDEEIYKIYYNSKLLTLGDYDYNEALRLKIIKKTDKLPRNYKRNFFVYMQKKNIYRNPVLKEELYTGKIKRFVYYVRELQQ